MDIITVNKDNCKVDSLYQWDFNRVLEIRGLSLPKTPEIHFTNDAMEKAIVRQATMDNAGVITVDIPNTLLQKPYKITVYVCIYEEDNFKSLYKFVIPIKARKKPTDYTFEDTEGEIYSYNALENKFNDALSVSLQRYEECSLKFETASRDYKEASQYIVDSKNNYDDAVEVLEESQTLYNQSSEMLNTAKSDYSNSVSNYNNARNEYEELTNKIAIVKGTLNSGDVEITIQSERITENSILSFYTSIYNANPINAVATVGSVTLTFEPQETNMEVGVRIDGDFI